MQDNMNMTANETSTVGEANAQPRVRENVPDDLIRLRNDLYRIAHDVRMKSKGASAELQHNGQALEREVMRFGAEVGQASEHSSSELAAIGADLRLRYAKLMSQIVFPSS